MKNKNGAVVNLPGKKRVFTWPRGDLLLAGGLACSVLVGWGFFVVQGLAGGGVV